MKTVQIYIQDQANGEYNRLDLFKDEKISITSSIQNINDISKTFTDFSQTFTLPGSVNNNKIFKHWYENANDDGFDTRLKSNAYIEIDTILFRIGKIQLESASLKDGQIENYSITFIGSLGNLKDKFGSLLLKDIGLGNLLTYTFNATNVKNSVTTTAVSADVMWPLITSKNYWTYGSGTGYRIDQNTKPIYFDELFPAVRLSIIFAALSAKFNVNFTGKFLSDKRFTNAYLLLKNADDFVFKTSKFINYDTVTVYGSPSLTSVNLTTDVITAKYYPGAPIIGTLNFDAKTKFTVAGLTYSVIVYKNGIQVNKVDKVTTSSTFDNYNVYSAPLSNLDYEGEYTFKIESSNILTFFNTAIQTYMRISGAVFYFEEYTQTPSSTLSSNLNLDDYTPEIKVEEFFSGILKMFNLTCYSNDAINYNLEQLENYYYDGLIVDITNYAKTDVVSLNRVNTYNKINFEYQPSESLVNKLFLEANSIEYGNFRYETGFDGSEYSIKLPFENLNFSEFTGTTLQVGYALKTDYQKYTPKPIILYDYNPNALTPANGTYYFATTPSSGAGTGTAYTNYKAFGQETTFMKYGVSNIYSLNFPTQQSTLTNNIIENGLYNQYYSNYLSNLFTDKSRIFKTTAILPTSILTSLKLNDRIVIRDKRYLINSMTTDLTNGEVQFELLTDFRTLINPLEAVTTLIGSQKWSIQNLDVTAYRNGDAIPQVTDPTVWASLTSGAWCYYNNIEENGLKYGKLYNWYAVNDARGLAPLGYHIPTSTEWNTLFTTVGGNSVAGGKLKEVGNTDWPLPSSSTDEFDLTILPTGYRGATGAFTSLPTFGLYHTATQQDATQNLFATFNTSNSVSVGFSSKKEGKAVRIVAD